MKYQTISIKQFFPAKGAIYYVAIATSIFSHVKITCYFHLWRYHVFARKLTWYSIGVYIIKINMIINYTIGLDFPLLSLWIFLKNQGFLHVFAKVQIVDVVSTERCVCQTDEGRFLEGKSRIEACKLFCKIVNRQD